MFEEGLAELHTHLGGSVSSDIMWTLAHEQGIALPVKDYWEFDRLVTVSDPRGVPNLDALDAIYHWTELIQSSPLAVERSVHAAIGGAYRPQKITTPRRRALRLHADRAHGRDGARGRARRHDPRGRGGRRSRPRGARRGDRVAAAGPDRARHPRRRRPGADDGAARARDRARDLPHLE